MASISTTAAAPSDNWLELPAVMDPSVTEGNAASASRFVEGRLPSSRDRVTSFWLTSPVSLSVTSMTVEMGTISSSKRPSAWPAAVRCWLAKAYSSCDSRETW